MNFKTSGEKRQNFSLRKLAVGLVSVAVACFFLMGTGLQTVSAQESHAVNYTYVLESDLTDEEKTLLVTSLPQVAEETDATYYLVYRANQVLPNTGTSSPLGTVALVAGLSLLVVVVLKGRDGKSKISRFLLVSALGSQLLSSTALALTSETLAAYNTQLSVQAGDALPAPVDIPGYTYIGYVKNKVDVVKQSDKQKAHDSKSNLENVDSSTIEEQQGGTPSPIESQLQKNNETVVQAKGSQEPGHEGDALVQPVQPTYTEPVSTQGTQESGHEGESLIQAEQPSYTAPISTQGTQEPGHEGDALVQPVQPTYTEPVSTQGTQEPGHEGEALVQPVQPTYTEPVSTQGTQESGHEGESLVQAEQPSYTAPISTKGTQEPGHEGESLVQSELPVYTGPQEGAPVEPTVPESTEVVSSKGTQEPGHEGEALVQPVQPSYTAPISTQGTQEPGHEGEALVQPVQPAYTDPISTQGTQESGHEGAALVQPVQPTYTEPVSTQGTQESGHDGEALVQPVQPAYTDPISTQGTQESGHEGEAAVVETLPELPLTSNHRTVTETIPHETEEIEDATILKNHREIAQEGKDGLRTIEYEDYLVDGKVEASKEISRTEVEPTKEIVKVGSLVKTKPTVEITNLVKDESKKAVAVNYRLDDPTSAFVKAKAQIFQNGTLIKEVDLKDLSVQQTIDGLDYYTPYTIKTYLTYNLGQSDQENTEVSTKDFQLDYKKIEIKDVDEVGLYGKEDGHYRRYLNLSEVPSDLSPYFVKVKSDKMKEMLLPVSSIKETEDGKYKVTVAFNELVQEKDSAYKDNYSFTVDKQKLAKDGVYTSFKKLIAAMQGNLAGTFKLGADMTADEVSLAKGQTSYVTGTFTGNLIGASDGKPFAIYDLKTALFDNLTKATVKDIDLKAVAIKSQDDTASLAKVATNSQISNVAVEGQLSGSKSVAGLVAKAQDTEITNSSFTGSIQDKHTDASPYYVGGIAGLLSGTKAKIDKVAVDTSISSNARNNDQFAGGIVGKVQSGALVSHALASGTILNTTTYPRIGGIAGSTWQNGRIHHVVSMVNTGDGYGITGDQYKGADIKDASTAVENKKADLYATPITQDQAREKVQSYGMTVTLDDTGQTLKDNQRSVDYTQLSQGQASRKVAYHNIEKLMPFYNKELVVHYGNQVDSTDKLYTTELLDVVPMKDNDIITDIQANKVAINKLMLHFADNTISYLDVTYKDDFKNTQIAEYSVAGKPFIFTPEAFLSDYTKVTDRVLADLQGVEYDSAAMRRVLGIEADASLDSLYLDKEFEKVKSNIGEHLRKVLAMDKSINTMGDSVAIYISEKIKNNKEAFLLGLTYLNRWYNINYDHINTKDLNTYKFDFDGNSTASTLDTIIALGQSGMENLKASNNTSAYETTLAAAKGRKTVTDLLESYRKLFLPTKTNNEWLKTNTKAYIVESKSAIPEVRAKQESATPGSNYTLGVYDRITAPSWKLKNMLLPLLTLPEEDVYVISNLSTLAFGGYERYRDRVNNTVLSGEELRQYVRAKVDQSAEWQRDHYDIWYHLLSPEYKEKLFRSVMVSDGFGMKDSSSKYYWATLSDKAIDSIYNFFGPTGKWYGESKGAGAYANGSEVHYVSDRLLDKYGTSVYTHEMVHNSDGHIYFEGKGRREGLGAELYALGLLQSADSLDKDAIVLNTLYKGDKDSPTRLHTYDPTSRFTSAAALQEYVHGMYDVLYTLDAMEANAILTKSNDVKKKWFRKIENFYIEDKYHKQTHAGNSVRPLTDAEVSKLTSLDALIDNDIINRRAYRDKSDYTRNGYHLISMFSPIYAALSNPKGAPGDIMFRKTAYELLAEKGYQDGFLPYVSNQYAEEAKRKGDITYSDWHRKDVGLITDSLVLKNVFANQYASWANFKKDMFDQRIRKQDQLKPITIQYELGVPNSSKEITIRSAAQMQELINQAVAKDVANIDRTTSHAPASWVHLLKQKIYNAYLRSTDDFRESIYKQ
ncbi:ZmpA/ZmpB/ZmpC family metallo-endopeptidase [Streptococcus mitis]|uniref:Immunoglobulin A1 protease n=1 Tax=Streptococcus mitis TaxID=28037 RepID=A0A3R9JS57_STRMT|nr:ZmpA/ZmpB/ZmpC family metallo-endopeptidase [Streptococcus mitis]RSI85901.1 Immunoglobulin A1 protease precursor [Streptococcus mitis]